jgi:hypothetical protein
VASKNATPDRRAAVVVLGKEAVVLRAQQADVVGPVIASHGEGAAVVELEQVPLGATQALLVHESAALAVALVHRASHRRRNVAGGTGSVRLGERFAWSHGLAETASFEPLQRVGYGSIDDRREVAVRDLRAQERRQPLELVAQLGAGGELDLEAGRRQRLDDGCP